MSTPDIDPFTTPPDRRATAAAQFAVLSARINAVREGAPMVSPDSVHLPTPEDLVRTTEELEHYQPADLHRGTDMRGPLPRTADTSGSSFGLYGHNPRN